MVMVLQPAGADEESTCEGSGGSSAGGQVQGPEEVEGAGQCICSLL